MRPTHRQRVEQARVHLEVEKRLAGINSARDRSSAFDRNEGVIGILDEHARLALGAAQSSHVNPNDPVWGPSARVNALALADVRAARSAWRSDGPPVEAAASVESVEWTPVPAWHREAGALRLRHDGREWVLALRGMEFGCGPVLRSELGEAGCVPRAEVVEAAARRALADPWGPEAPPGSVSGYVADPDDPDEVIEVRVPTEPPPAPPAPVPAAPTPRTRREPWLSRLTGRP